MKGLHSNGGLQLWTFTWKSRDSGSLLKLAQEANCHLTLALKWCCCVNYFKVLFNSVPSLFLQTESCVCVCVCEGSCLCILGCHHLTCLWKGAFMIHRRSGCVSRNPTSHEGCVLPAGVTEIHLVSLAGDSCVFCSFVAAAMLALVRLQQ